jgi:hypothetical protein
MPYCNINGQDVNILLNPKPSKAVEERGLSEGMSANGSIISTSVRQTGIWKGKVEPMPIADAWSLYNILMGRGHLWTFDNDRYCSKGFASIFTRTTTRYNQITGAAISTGTPCYLDGPFGSSYKGIDIWQGASTLVTQGFLSGTYTGGVCAGWSNYNSATLSENTNVSYLCFGTKSQKVIANAANKGISQTFTVANGVAYYAKAKIYIVSGRVKLDCRFGSTHSSQTSTAGVTGWVELVVTRTTDGTSGAFLIYSIDGAAEFYVDACQYELGSFPTPNTDVTRNNESLYLPATFLSATELTIAGWVLITNITKRSTERNVMFRLLMSGDSLGAIVWRHSLSAATWDLVSSKGETAEETKVITIDESFTPNGWHYFVIAVDFKNAIVKGYIDNALRGTITDALLPSALGTKMYIGSSSGSSLFLNTTFADVRLLPFFVTENQLTDLTRPHAPIPKLNVYGDWVNRSSSNPISCTAKVGEIEESWANNQKMGSFDLTLREV